LKFSQLLTAQASTAPANRIDASAAFFIAHFVWALFITRKEIKESVIYTAEGDRY
jgi:hypothetical protein